MAKTLSFTDTSPQTVKIGDTTTSFTLICGNDNVATDLTNATSITVKLGNASGYLKSATIDPTSLTDPTTGQVTVTFNADLMTSLPAGSYSIEVWVVDSTGTSIYPSDGSTGFAITNNIQSANGSTITKITFDDFVKAMNKAASTIAKGDKGDKGDPGDGSPQFIDNLTALQTKYPTGTKGLFVTLDTGLRYVYVNANWKSFGTYQATGIAPNSVATEAIKQSAVTIKKIDGLTINSVHSINQFDSKNAVSGAMTATGFSNSTNWVHTNYIMVSAGAVVHINKAYNNYLCTYDKFGNFVKAYESSSNGNAAEVALDDNVKFIIVNCFVDYLDEFMVTINDPMPDIYQPFTVATDNVEINWLYFKDNSISPAKLSGTKIVKKRSINRYNGQDTVPNQVATLSGIVTYQNWQRTDYLNVSPGDVVTFTNAFGTIATCYDQTKQPIKSWSYQNKQGQTIIIMPENACFIIINVFKDWSNFMFSINESLPDTYDPFVKNDVVDAAWISRSKFENKSAMMFGDSITWYDGHVQPTGTIAVGYETWLKQQLGFVEAQNLGISGAPFATGKTSDNGIGAKIESEYKTTDLVLIAGGTNDFKLDVPLGEVQPVSGAFDKTTTAGALQSALEHILTTNNDQEILLMTPIQRDNSSYSIYSTNKAGFKLDDYRQMIIKLGELYSIPVWDGYAESGLNLLNLNKYTLDGLHPNNAGFERISKSLCAYIKGVF